MARSSYIYIPVVPDYDGDRIEAAFTVKHECQTWLERNPSPDRAREVLRVPDGLWRTSDAVRVSEEEFLR